MTTISSPTDPILSMPVGARTYINLPPSSDDVGVSRDVHRAFDQGVTGVTENVPDVGGRIPDVTSDGVDSPHRVDIGGTIRSPENESPATGIESFSQALTEAMGAVNNVQMSADTQAQKFAAGKKMQIHETMLAMEKASITLKFLGSVRNRMLEAYQEIMRMNV